MSQIPLRPRQPATDFAAFRARHGTTRPAFPTRPVPDRGIPMARVIPPPVTGSVAERGLSRIGLVLGVSLAALTLGAYGIFGTGSPVSPSGPARAAAPAPAPGVPSDTPTPTVAPTLENLPPGAAVDFPWLTTQGDGRPVTWPCGPIGYRLITDGAPAGARELLTEAVSRTSAVSGLQFREDPPVDSSAAAHGYSGIDVSWVPREQLPQAMANPTVVGVGGASSNGAHFTYGYVNIVSDWPGSSKADFGAESVGPVLMHELGHALGLEHTTDPKAVMFPSDHGVSNWTQPERAALRYLQQACG